MTYSSLFVYQSDESLWWLLLLMTPVLLFIGYFLAKILFKDHEYAEPTDVVVMPPDLTWMNYTNNLYVIEEISRAVVGLRIKAPIRYEQIQPFLKSKEAHRVAELVQEFHVYREEEIRQYLRQAYQLQQGKAQRPGPAAPMEA